jgi:hypothetical protein
MKSVALVSYNVVVPNKLNGWKDTKKGDGRILLLQPEIPTSSGQRMLYFGDNEEGRDAVRKIINGLWPTLDSNLSSLDRVVFYLGAGGSEAFIERVAESELFKSLQKVVFFICSCKMQEYVNLIKKHKLNASKVFKCNMTANDCEGTQTMGSLYDYFMDTGELFEFMK